MHHQREQIIRDYFNAWLRQDPEPLSRIFHKNIIYSEAYGQVYQGFSQVWRWFADFNNNGQVLRWDILQFIHSKNTSAVEWYFECTYKDHFAGSKFNGVSLYIFESDNRVICVKEFSSMPPRFTASDSVI